MASRVGLLAILLFVGIGVASASARQPPSGTAMYVVRQDPRLCPSPRCGGYWVTIANGGRTRCQDGKRHVRCYVAVAVGRRGASLGILAEGALVRGALDIGRSDFGELIVWAVYPRAGTAIPGGGFYRVRDTGIRCVRAPCFSYRATGVNGSLSIVLSGVDLEAAKAQPREVARAEAALPTKDGLYARGRFSTGLDGGRTFHATQLFLRAPLPRA